MDFRRKTLNEQMKENKNGGNLNDVNNKIESAVLYQPNNTNLNPAYVGNDNNNRDLPRPSVPFLLSFYLLFPPFNIRTEIGSN